MKVIDSPKHRRINGEMKRPNTKNTICQWLATGPQPGSCLVISTQPFIGYQEAIFKYILPSEFEIEAIGPGTNNRYPNADLDLDNHNTPFPLSVYLDNFAKWLLYEQLKDL